MTLERQIFKQNFAKTNHPSLTALFNRRPLLGYIWVCGPQSLVANPPLSWQVARCKPWALLVTKRPTCQIAALYTHWCRMRKGLTSTALFSAEALEPTPADLCVPPYRETTVVCPLASEPTEPLLGTYQAGHKLEIPGSRCHNPLSTKQKLAIKCTKPASIYQTAKH